MANTKISALTELSGADVDIAADFLAIVDTGATESKKIIPSNLLGAAFTTAGDILQASGDGVAARLGIGTARQVPTVNSGATALAYANPITIATEQASTSGTSIDFTGIPAGVRRITIMFVGVSTNGTSNRLIQLGDAGGFENSGYSGSGTLFSSTALNVANYTTGFGIQTGSASDVLSGTMILTLEDASDFTWTCMSVTSVSNSTAQFITAGSKALSATLTQVRITTVNGTDAYDAGAINISYE